MNKFQKHKNKEWYGKVAQARMDRKNYPAGPAAGKEMWELYKKYFRRALAGKKKANVLVFGATPEYRDFALAEGHNVVVVDFSLEMILKMSQVMKYQNDPREILVRGNWLDLQYLKENYFDIAVGSGITNNLLPGTHNKFFREVRRVLKKSGHILLHDAVILPKKSIKPILWYLSEYKQEKLHWFDIFMDARFFSDKTKKSQPAKYVYDMAAFGKILKKYYLQMPEKLIMNLEAFGGKINHTLFPEKMFKKMISKYFTLSPTQKACDYLFCDFIYHFFAKVKK